MTTQEKENWEKIKYKLSESILHYMELRGFYDAGKYLNEGIAETIKPFFDSILESTIQSLIAESEGMKKIPYISHDGSGKPTPKGIYNQAISDFQTIIRNHMKK